MIRRKVFGEPLDSRAESMQWVVFGFSGFYWLICRCAICPKLPLVCAVLRDGSDVPSMGHNSSDAYQPLASCSFFYIVTIASLSAYILVSIFSFFSVVYNKSNLVRQRRTNIQYGPFSKTNLYSQPRRPLWKPPNYFWPLFLSIHLVHRWQPFQ
jgi:hypothetical protein